jgi:hypothetical protein
MEQRYGSKPDSFHSAPGGHGFSSRLLAALARQDWQAKADIGGRGHRLSSYYVLVAFFATDVNQRRATGLVLSDRWRGWTEAGTTEASEL